MYVGDDGFLHLGDRRAKAEIHIALPWGQVIFAFMIPLAALVEGLGSGLNQGRDFVCK
jgi:hypothetical protein